MSIYLPNDIYFRVASTVRDQPFNSRAKIARALNISPSTIGRVVDQLITLNLLRESDQKQSESGAGRPAISLEFNFEIASVLTIDLRLTEAYAAITDLSGKFLAQAMRSLSAGDANRSFEDLVSLITELLQSLSEYPPVLGIIIGAPSIVDVQNGVVEWAQSLGWENLNIKALLEERFTIPVLVENDVNLAALGEYWNGAGKDTKGNLVFVSVGTGIGAGIILNGELYRGATNAAGEVAYFIVDVNVLRDNAAKIGNLENRVGRDGLINLAHLVAQRYPSSKLTELLRFGQMKIEPGDILELAEEGDPAGLVVFNELVQNLTIVVCNIAVVLDPEMIILGGPTARKWQALIPAIQERINSSLLRPIKLIPSKLGNDALILGGAYSALSLLRRVPAPG